MSEPELRHAIELSEAFADDPSSVHPAISAAAKVIDALSLDVFARGFVGEPTAPGIRERMKLVCEASGEVVHPSGVALGVLNVAGEGGIDGPISRTVAALLRDVVGPFPFRSVEFLAEWRTSTAVALAASMYERRDFGAMPVLADALEEAGCDSGEVLAHCRGPGPHCRGCWVLDAVLGRA